MQLERILAFPVKGTETGSDGCYPGTSLVSVRTLWCCCDAHNKREPRLAQRRSCRSVSRCVQLSLNVDLGAELPSDRVVKEYMYTRSNLRSGLTWHCRSDVWLSEEPLLQPHLSNSAAEINEEKLISFDPSQICSG